MLDMCDLRMKANDMLEMFRVKSIPAKLDQRVELCKELLDIAATMQVRSFVLLLLN